MIVGFVLLLFGFMSNFAAICLYCEVRDNYERSQKTLTKEGGRFFGLFVFFFCLSFIATALAGGTLAGAWR